MPPSAHKLAAVVSLMAIWWVGEAVPIPVTALIPIVLFPVLGIMSAKEIAPNYTNHLVFLFFGGFSIALAMEKWGLHKQSEPFWGLCWPRAFSPCGYQTLRRF